MLAIRLLSLLLLCSSAFAASYTTSFPSDENPISQSGNWINGKSTGIVWSNCAVTSGLLHGTQVSASPAFSDSVALLTGTWAGGTQSVVVVVHHLNQSGTVEEVEVRLRSTLTANSSTGYEINISVNDADHYAQIVRWNGPFGSFDLIDSRAIPHVSGDFTFEGAITNNTAYIKTNGVTAYTADITSIGGTVYTTGNPGAGFYLEAANVSGNYGFTSFTATDGQPNPSTSGTDFHGGTIAGGTIKTQ